MVSAVESKHRGRVSEKSAEEQAENEVTKRERFVKVASRRTTNALRSVNQLRNCLSTSSYKYSGDDWEKIMEVLSIAVSDLGREAERRLSGQRESKEKIAFTL